MRDVDALVLAGRLADRDLAAGLAVLSHLDAVVDLHAGVDLAVKDAVGPLARALNGRGVPFPAGRRRDPVLVQALGDLARRHPVMDIHGEDAPDDLGLFGDDLDQAAGLGAIAVEARAGGEALFGVGRHAPLGLQAEVADEVLGDEALERDVHVLDAIGGQGGDAGADVGQPVRHVRQVLEVAGQAVFVLGQQQVELAPLGRRQGRKETWAIRHGRAGDGRIGIGGDDRPALGGRVLDQQIQLVGDRALVLAIGAVAGVKGDAGHGRPPSQWACVAALSRRGLEQVLLCGAVATTAVHCAISRRDDRLGVR
nr:hypothetical protein [Brevundimonas naejangsanensis]